MGAMSVAKSYFQLSNEQNFEGIKNLLAELASYTSPALGTLTGRDEIIDKQKEFYKAHKGLIWYDKSYKEIKPSTIVVDYDCEATTKDDEIMSWSGLEYITVKDGKIIGIEIKIKS